MTKFDCLCFGGEWVNKNLNYDNILIAIATLFSVTLTGWTRRMFHIVDAVGIDMEPVQNANPNWEAFFIVFIVIFNFFLLDLFVGAVVKTFNEQNEKLAKNNLLSNK